MRIHPIDLTKPKGWYEGPWNSDLKLSVGYANEGINEPHLHRSVTEIYLVASGTAVVRVGAREFTLYKGDMLVIEPGEAHTFLSNSPDYLHFVIHTPGLAVDAARADKVLG
jgi:mannose-6-phosphate isomerase-like protein (cupin superfamily)